MAGIGVIFDFVLAHFARDSYALKNFGGTSLYEPTDPGRQVTEWHSMNFDYSKGPVRSFLQSAANYWLKEYKYYNQVKDAFVSKAAQNFFNTNELVKMLDQHKAGKIDNSKKIWVVYMFLVWYDVYFVQENMGGF